VFTTSVDGNVFGGGRIAEPNNAWDTTVPCIPFTVGFVEMVKEED
jgi:hypothetical protein